MRVDLKRFVIVALVISVILAVFVSPFASSSLDGLEKVAEKHGFLERGENSVWGYFPIADYLFPGIKNEGVATGLAGLIGVIVVFGVGYGLLVVVKKIAFGRSRGTE